MNWSSEHKRVYEEWDDHDLSDSFQDRVKSMTNTPKGNLFMKILWRIIIVVGIIILFAILFS